MSNPIEKLGEFLIRIGALEGRIDDAIRITTRMEEKLDSILQRITKLETEQSYLRQNVKSEIMSDIKTEIAVIQERMRTLTMISDGPKKD